MVIEQVRPAAVRTLRTQLLRPGAAPRELVYPGDDLPGAWHGLAYGADDAHIGIVSITPEPHPRDPRSGDWRVRGMATVPAVRGQGVGAALLAAALDAADRLGGRRVWCNARTTAAGFYRRHGFVVEGDEFDLPGIGPHVLMTRALAGVEKSRDADVENAGPGSA